MCPLRCRAGFDRVLLSAKVGGTSQSVEQGLAQSYDALQEVSV